MLKLKSRILTISLLLLFAVMALAACGTGSAGAPADTGAVSSESRNSDRSNTKISESSSASSVATNGVAADVDSMAKYSDATGKVAVVKEGDAERKRVAPSVIGREGDQTPATDSDSREESGSGPDNSGGEKITDDGAGKEDQLVKNADAGEGESAKTSEGSTGGSIAVTPPVSALAPPNSSGEEATDDPDSVLPVGGRVGNQAPEFQRITNWINSDPLTMEALRGNVVLIDFWTYTCINCIRTLPYLKEWQDKYADKGLVIVGVHSPEFEFEKLTDNVVNSTVDYELVYPVAQDNHFATWQAYSNRYWPAKYLIDHQGVVRYTHFGEGKYAETEAKIRELLEEAGAALDGESLSGLSEPRRDPGSFSSDPALKQTREIYGGYHRNASPGGTYVGQSEYYGGPERVLTFEDPGNHQNQFMYLNGPWFSGFEELKHARQTQNYEDYIALKFAAVSVNAVINPPSQEQFEVEVTLDGVAVLPEEAGADLIIEDGRSFFTVDGGRLYEVIALPEFASRELRLSSNSEAFALFAFTFGSYTTGP